MIGVMAQSHPVTGLVGRIVGHYRVLEALGSGGMGEVYLAEDTKLGRRVALKVLPPETAAHPEKIQRFEREARAIASLNHPNIVTIHSIEEADGLSFLTMEHVEGETLARALPARGFPTERLLPLAIAMSDALAAAHRQGILHRDLKPENVMLTPEGRLKVLDFGLAKLRADVPEDADRTTRETQSVTQDGRIVGTVAYMSPEQAQGLPVDHRSDIFSLGILLYEMATGERPFKGATNLSVLSAILKDTPRPVTQIRDEVPRPLARMIQRALEKRPEDRYQSTTDLRKDLEDLKHDVDSGELGALATTAGRRRLRLPAVERRWALPAAAAAAIVVLVLAGVVLLRDRGRRSPADARTSVAVLYFDNLSGDPSLDWLRTGLTDMLVTNLSQAPGLRVLSTGRLDQILDELGHRDDRTVSAPVVAQVARRAEVATALVGSYVRAGGQLRIQARLQDPSSGEVLASERVEGDAEDGLFALVDQLTDRVRSRLDAKAMAEGHESKLEQVTTSSVEAYRLFAEGMRHHNRLEEREAQALLEKAIAADPGFAMANAKLSVVHANLGDKDKAREYAARALEKAEKLPPGERYYIEGRYYSLNPETLPRAVEAYQKAVDSEPDHSSARNNLAQLLMESRRNGEAIVHLEELRRRGMTFPGTYMSLAEAYVATGQADRAEEALREYVAQHPDRSAGQENLGYLLAYRGRHGEALQAFDAALRLDPKSSTAEAGRCAVHVLGGEWDAAEAAARRLRAWPDPVGRFMGGQAQLVLGLYHGHFDRALLDKGVEEARDRPDLRMGVRIFGAELEYRLGRYRAALKEADRIIQERSADPERVATAHGVRALCLTRLGKTGDAKASVDAAQGWLQGLPPAFAEPMELYFRGELALARGDHAAALPVLRKGAELLEGPTLKPSPYAVDLRLALAKAALETGHRDEARRALVRVTEGGLERLISPIAYLRALALLARFEEQAGRTAEARRLYERYLDCWKDGEIDREEVARAGRRLAALRAEPAA